jgi:hypothetical protein
MPKAKVFEVSEMIPEETIIPRKYQPATDETLLEVHRNRGGHLGNMDDVDRGSWPDASVLESKIMGNEDIPTSVDAGVRPELSGKAGYPPNENIGSRRGGPAGAEDDGPDTRTPKEKGSRKQPKEHIDGSMHERGNY